MPFSPSCCKRRWWSAVSNVLSSRCGYHLTHMTLRFYMSCFQLNVGGSGTATPSTVNIPGAYAATDPGILIGELKELIKLIKILTTVLDIYVSPTAYTIPGPTPYGTTSPTVASTAFPATATWNTALQPTTVPTTPETTGIGTA